MPRRAALFALLAALSGCGSSPAVREPDGTVEITLRDFRMTPQQVRSQAGDLTIIVRNEGRLPHNLRIRGIGGTRVKVRTMLPGASAARVVRLPKGDWRMFCSLANHEELGLYGTLRLP